MNDMGQIIMNRIETLDPVKKKMMIIPVGFSVCHHAGIVQPSLPAIDWLF